MLIPFSYSLNDAALDLFGAIIMSQLPQESLDALSQDWIVDQSGMMIWTLLTLIIGIYIGRKTKRTKIIKQSNQQ